MALMLIVEPEASLRTLIYEVLEQEGYVVIEAANSYEGLVAGDAAVPADITLEISYLVVF
jgi:DNA-binding response OmpR family regulator